jgi:hypothetical protein
MSANNKKSFIELTVTVGLSHEGSALGEVQRQFLLISVQMTSKVPKCTFLLEGKNGRDQRLGLSIRLLSHSSSSRNRRQQSSGRFRLGSKTGLDRLGRD